MPEEPSDFPPRVLVVGLGGTIAMTAVTTSGVTPSLSVQQLVDAVPAIGAIGVEIDVLNFQNRPGASLDIDDLTALASEISKRVQAGFSGVVVTQGTDTIEESAYILDLLHAEVEPVVVTGAMRNPTLAGADGPANLLAAIKVAADPQARGLGCLVVMADEIHAAHRVRKTHSTSVGTFVSPNGGPLGYLVEGRVTLVNKATAGRFTLPAPRHRPGRVGLYTATLGDDGYLLTAVGKDVDGLVVAGFGVGHVPERWLPVLTEIAARIPVVLASRAGSGPVLTQTYGFPGSERDLIARGAIPAGLLDPYKARVLLHLALAAGAEGEQIAAAFSAAGGLADEQAWPWTRSGKSSAEASGDR